MKFFLLAISFVFLFSFAAPAFASSAGQISGQACSATQPCPTYDVCYDGTCAIIINKGVSQQVTQGSFQQCTSGLCNPLKVKSIHGLLTDILSFVVKIGTIIVVLMLVVTGFKFVIAQGNPAELEKAKKMLLWTLIGALIILGAQTISLMVQATVNSLAPTP